MHLKLWTYDIGDGDYFVAESAEEADKMLKKEFGYTLAEHGDADFMDWKWVSIPDDKIITITLEDPAHGLPEGKHKLSASEWCERAGAGYLFSMNNLP